MKTLIKLFFLSFTISVCLIGKSISEDKIKIGLIVPLTGEYKEIGDSIVKSVIMAANKIDDDNIEIHIKDNSSRPRDTFLAAKELNEAGIKIVIGPIFQKNLKLLSSFSDMTFLSLTNKIESNPKNVISVGVNAISQINTIKKFLKKENLERSLFLIPDTSFKNEIELAIKKTKLNLKNKFVYDTDPTILTDQIEKITRYPQRKQNLLNEIKRLEAFEDNKYEKQIENLKKKDTLGGINFDSAIIGDFDEGLKSVATSLLYTDISSSRIKYITLNQWFDQSLLRETNLQPIYFPSVNKKNFENFNKEYLKKFGENSNQVSFLSYDAVGLVYFLILKNNFLINEDIFLKENKFKGKVGIFEIKNNIITHQLNFYMIDKKEITKIF
ncbi:MAG: penicillin-binding protein activator [Candidatus Pelagibacter sp.]